MNETQQNAKMPVLTSLQFFFQNVYQENLLRLNDRDMS
jgi:hypothetical protein